jgi:hypothetical protein
LLPLAPAWTLPRLDPALTLPCPALHLPCTWPTVSATPSRVTHRGSVAHHQTPLPSSGRLNHPALRLTLSE